jgi:cation diffusion facilitator CzcD-associated flavoprotein CzcO
MKPLTNTRCEITLSISSALCYNFDTKKLWTITTENTSTAEETITPVSLSLAVWLYLAIPQFTDQSRFEGKIIHPQKWPENLNVDKTIIVEVELLLSLLCPS